MSTLTLSRRVAEEAFPAHDDFTSYRSQLERRHWDSVAVPATALSDEGLALLASSIAAQDALTREEKRAAKLIDAVMAVRSGNDAPVRSVADFPPMFAAWVERNCSRGWLMRKDDASAEVMLVTQCTFYPGDPQRGPDSARIDLMANAPGMKSDRKAGGCSTSSVSVESENLFSKRSDSGKRVRIGVGEVLATMGYFPPTDEDLAAHDSARDEFEEVLATGFAQQYLHTGYFTCVGYSGFRGDQVGAKVVHDVHPKEIAASNPVVEVWRHARSEHQEPVLRELPVQTKLHVFDLAKQEFGHVDTRDLTAYEYDASLREKLVLPSTHRELLDVLTTDLNDYSSDIVEGKSAGNVILAQGRPGVGKTLTAEVYAELVERPLYAIHSGSLGVTAESVRKNLETIFNRAARWDAVLLLDEADVFVTERGGSVEQNAIVAEFLRTLEYFKGLLFMTTNRSDSIDDAILSRCAAIIAYDVPERDDARRVWDVLIANVGAQDKVSDDLVEQLLDEYPALAPRDIKMVLRLALRIADKRGTNPDLSIFERCILFRGLTDAAKRAAPDCKGRGK